MPFLYKVVREVLSGNASSVIWTSDCKTQTDNVLGVVEEQQGGQCGGKRRDKERAIYKVRRRGLGGRREPQMRRAWGATLRFLAFNLGEMGNLWSVLSNNI